MLLQRGRCLWLRGWMVLLRQPGYEQLPIREPLLIY